MNYTHKDPTCFSTKKYPNAKTQQTAKTDPISCIGEDPTAQRPSTLHNKIQPHFSISYHDGG